MVVFALLLIPNIVKADDPEDTIQWTDFSNATYEIKYVFDTQARLIISDFTIDNNATYWWFITPNSTKPEFNESDINNYNYYLGGDKTNITEYVELNQDLYFWMVERKYDEQSNPHFKFVVEGQKIERTGYYKDNRIFNGSTLTGDWTWLKFSNIAWGKHTRNINVKVGKITDVNLLNKLKNKESGAFTDLLEYSKNAKTICNDTLTSTTKTGDYYSGYDSMYNNDICLKIQRSDVQHNAYYFVYVSLDDENGKYYPVEAVMLGMATNNPTAEGYGIYFYGSNQFSWDGLTIDETTPTEKEPAVTPTSTTQKKDTTTAGGKLPYTGGTFAIILGGVAVLLIGGYAFKRNKDLKGIK